MASEVISGKDLEGMLQAMIFMVESWKHHPELDQNQIYYVLQGPQYLMDRFIYLNANRPKIAIQRHPDNKDLTSWVYFSNRPEHPHAFKFNVHYGSLRATQTSNKLGQMIFPIPDFGKIHAENTLNTPFEDPNKDIISAITKKGY